MHTEESRTDISSCSEKTDFDTNNKTELYSTILKDDLKEICHNFEKKAISPEMREHFQKSYENNGFCSREKKDVPGRYGVWGWVKTCPKCHLEKPYE